MAAADGIEGHGGRYDDDGGGYDFDHRRPFASLTVLVNLANHVLVDRVRTQPPVDCGLRRPVDDK